MLLGFGSTNNTATIQSQIVAAANQYGVDPNLALALAEQESGLRQYGSNGAVLTSAPIGSGQGGALGVMQLMPGTAAQLGVDPTDQTQNIDGGVKYLSQLLTQFGGNTTSAIAAYNAGPGAVQKYGGIPPYAETQQYVSAVQANYNALGGPSQDSSGASQDSSSSSQDTTAPSSTSSFSSLDLSSLSSLSSLDPTTIAIAAAVAIGAAFLFTE